KIGFEKEDRAVVADEGVFMLEVIDQIHDRAIGFGKILVSDAELVGGADMRGENEVPAVLRDLGAEAPFRMIGPLVHKHVVVLRRSHAMVVDLLIEGEAVKLSAILFGFVIAAV